MTRTMTRYGWLAFALSAVAHTAAGQETAPDAARRLPFFVGESLVYRVKSSRVGNIGKATMIIDPVEDVRGTPTMVLRFAFRARVGLVTAEDQSASWLDPERLASLRFHKHEKHPLSRHDERVEVFPDTHRWQANDGSGTIVTDAPLDELSFMYVLRTLPLDADTAVRLDRHFDAARNPTTVRVLGRRTMTTEAGTFRTIQVEMRVMDERRYHGEGVIRLDLTDDHCRIPVRIESQMPVVGRTTMTLDTQNHPATHHLAREVGGV
jgi:hypothetical protein